MGGPDVYTHRELAEMAFAALGTPARITCLPDIFRRVALRTLPHVTPRRIHGPAHFFLTAMGMDMIGEASGVRHLADHFESLAKEEAAARG